MRRHGFDAFIPDKADLPNFRTQNYVPYVFSHSEIQRFFAACFKKRNFRTAYDFRYQTMMGMIFELLYCCGLRVAEAINLTPADVDLDNGILTIRFAKFEKSRYIPLSDDVISDLRRYMSSQVHAPFLFPGRNGQRLNKNSVYEKFRQTLLIANIPHYGRGTGPRVHDLRHTFACHCLQRWIRNGVPISSALPRLSTYLGHNTINATEKYLRMTAEVYPEISEKLSKDYGDLIPREDENETN